MTLNQEQNNSDESILSAQQLLENFLDTGVDEGKLFAARLLGKPLTSSELTLLNSEVSLNEGILYAQEYLYQFLTQPDLIQQLEKVFGPGAENFSINLLRSLPTVIITEDLPVNVRGAYATAHNTIYLSQGLIKRGDREEIAFVWLEELAHYLDSQLNVIDTKGDEGELLASLVLGKPITASQLARLKRENDWTKVSIQAQSLLVEKSTAHPEYPWIIGSYDTPYRAYDVEIVGNLAYIADGNSGIQVIDISNPSAPTFKEWYGTPGHGYGVKIVGDLVYVADGSAGLSIFDAYESSPTPTIQYSQPTYQVTEDGSTATLTLNRTGDLSNSSTVQVEITGGTATGGVDYDNSNFPQTVTFAANETSKTIDITIYDDNEVEGTENVQFNLIAGDNAILGSQNTAIFEVLDKKITLGYADVVVDYFNSGNGTFPEPYGGEFPGGIGFPVLVSKDVVLGNDPNNTVDFLSLPDGSFITVAFKDEVIIDGNGDDIFIKEVGGNGERADVFVTSDLINFTFLGKAYDDTDTSFDLASIDFNEPVKAIKIVGLDSFGESPGFDVVNIQALTGSFYELPLATHTQLEIFAKDTAYRDWDIGDYVHLDPETQKQELYPDSGYIVDQIWNDLNTGLYALGLTNPNEAPVLVIRGTELTFGDIINDLNAESIGDEQFDQNFKFSTASLNPEEERKNESIKDWLDNSTKFRPYVTGHSLGGAITQLIGANYTDNGDELAEIVTFNSPGIDSSESGKFNPSKVEGVTHYINVGDIVSMAGQSYLEGEAKLANYSDILSAIDFFEILTKHKHLVPILADEIKLGGRKQPTTWTEPKFTTISAAELSDDNFSYYDYEPHEDYEQLSVILFGLGLGLKSKYRGTVEETRQEIGEAIIGFVQELENTGKIELPDLTFAIGNDFNTDQIINLGGDLTENAIFALQSKDVALRYIVGGKLNSESLNVDGNISILAGLITGTAEIELNWNEGYYRGKNLDATALGGLITLNGDYSINSNADINFLVTGSINVPKINFFNSFEFGGQELASGLVYLDFTNDDDYSNDYIAAWSEVTVGPFWNRRQEERGFRLYLDGSHEKIGVAEINAINPQLNIASFSLSHENTLDSDNQIQPLATDISKTFPINVTDVDENVDPTDIQLDGNSVPENQPAGTVVGTFSTTDADAGDTHTYSLVSGGGSTDNSQFKLVDNQLQTNGSFDYETKNTYSIRVQTEDSQGGTYSESFTINVTDVDENVDPTDIELDNNHVDENQAVGTTVGNFSTIDPNGDLNFTYSLVNGVGDTDNNSFTVENNQLLTAATFDYESQASYSIRVQTDDSNGGTFQEIFTIQINDLDERVVDEWLYGDNGHNLMLGNQGNDNIYGSNGNDTMYGGKHQDLLEGEAGDDWMNGNNGDDAVNGGDGNDSVYGGKERDLLNGEAGDDWLNGNKGDDSVDGGDGKDLLFGGQGQDLLNGEAGDDWLSGNKEDDTLTGVMAMILSMAVKATTFSRGMTVTIYS